jgi:hypothetical protein
MIVTGHARSASQDPVRVRTGASPVHGLGTSADRAVAGAADRAVTG